MKIICVVLGIGLLLNSTYGFSHENYEITIRKATKLSNEMKSIALAKANNTRWERQHEFVHSTAIQSRDSLQDLYNKINAIRYRAQLNEERTKPDCNRGKKSPRCPIYHVQYMPSRIAQIKWLALLKQIEPHLTLDKLAARKKTTTYTEYLRSKHRMEFMTKFRSMVLDMWNYYKTREQYRTDSWNTRVYTNRTFVKIQQLYNDLLTKFTQQKEKNIAKQYAKALKEANDYLQSVIDAHVTEDKFTMAKGLRLRDEWQDKRDALIDAIRNLLLEMVEKDKLTKTN